MMPRPCQIRSTPTNTQNAQPSLTMASGKCLRRQPEQHYKSKRRSHQNAASCKRSRLHASKLARHGSGQQEVLKRINAFNIHVCVWGTERLCNISGCALKVKDSSGSASILCLIAVVIIRGNRLNLQLQIYETTFLSFSLEELLVSCVMSSQDQEQPQFKHVSFVYLQERLWLQVKTRSSQVCLMYTENDEVVLLVKERDKNVLISN